MTILPFTLLESAHWTDYALLDSGDGLKLERFGKYIFVRPEPQAMWTRSLDANAEWKQAHAVFQPTGEESGGIGISKSKWRRSGRCTTPLYPPIFKKMGGGKGG